jgi:hypothetical protein
MEASEGLSRILHLQDALAAGDFHDLRNGSKRARGPQLPPEKEVPSQP